MTGRVAADAALDLPTWTRLLATRLGIPEGDDIDVAVDVGPILDLARDAAHHVMRPAAPVTTFLTGYAAGLRGGGGAAIAEAVAVAAALTVEATAAELRP